MFRHIRSKLIAAFAVPLAILVAVAGLQSLSSLGQISSVNNETNLANASVGPGGVVAQIQLEREFAITTILSLDPNLPGSISSLNPVTAGFDQTPAQIEQQTDAAVASFRRTIAGAGSQAQATFAKAVTQLGNLKQARAEWALAAKDQSTPGAMLKDKAVPMERQTYEAYTSIINSLKQATATVPQQINDPVLRNGVEALNASLQHTEAEWQAVQDVVNVAEAKGQAAVQDIATANEAWGQTQQYAAELQSFGRGSYSRAVNLLTSSPVDQSLQLVMTTLSPQYVASLIGMMSSFTEPVSLQQTLTPVQAGNAAIAHAVAVRASKLHSNAVQSALLFIGIGVIGTVLGLLLVVLVSRSVSRPLVDLAHQAEELAHNTLPSTVRAILESSSGGEAPKPPKVSVKSHDEVGLMATALEEVNKTAVELAAGQAALRRNLADAFVNLGRRNQNLVTRQLEYISEIELKEADPASLEELFRLDHLATRMRRNAESLLILAGSGPARQWSASVPAMDVARAASAEVEDYKRLRLHHFDPAQINGAITTDLVHIMAELVENALSFSPPGSPVDVYGRFLEGGYVIVIVDSGIGMSAEDLEVANRRLEGVGADDEVPGRYLGHFVAGRLASRHGIAISLQQSHSGGLVARVKIPAELIEDAVPDLSAGADMGSDPVSELPSAPSVAVTSAPVSASVGVADATSPGISVLPASPQDGSSSGNDNRMSEADYNNADFEHEMAELAQTYGAERVLDEAAFRQAPSDDASHGDVNDADGTQGSAEVFAGGTQPVASDQTTEIPALAYEATDIVEQAPAAPFAHNGATATAPELPTPDLGISSPLAAPAGAPGGAGVTEAVAAGAVTASASWGSAASPETAPAVGPAAQARSTADGLRKLTRRVPGASLPVEDDSLRRATPASTSHNPLGLTGALSQYLTATVKDGRPEKEQNSR
ncbi:MAG TPA: ATP-binding protein [Acidimicrobiales bacterium]|nr:ATP-binding protein [Acidimicrobiales bacterium]